MQRDDPVWRKYLQNVNYFVGSLEQTMQCDANDAVIYGQQYIRRGQQQPSQPHSSKLTKRAKQRTNSAMHSFYTADQCSTIDRSTAN